MARSASKYILQIVAQYKQSGDIKALQQQLNTLDRMDLFAKQRAQADQLAAQLAAARTRARELGDEMMRGGSITAWQRAEQDAAKLKAQLDLARTAANQTAAALQSAGVQISNYANQYKALETAALQTAQTLAARKIFGTRGTADIQAEMERLKAAYRDLARSGVASTEELSRAADAYRARWRALRAELQVPVRPTKVDLARNLLGTRSAADIRTEIVKIRTAYQTLAKSGQASMYELTRAHARAKEKIAELTGSTSKMASTFSTARAMIAGMAISLATLTVQRIGQRVNIADQYRAAAISIKLVAENEKEALMIQERLYKLSQETGASYIGGIGTFTKLAYALQSAGVKAEGVLEIVEMINKTLALNGSTAQMAAAFNLQFSQAIGMGVLRGQEFRSVLESNSYFAIQLARALDTDIAGMRKMSKEGKLTNDVLLTAFPKMLGKIREAYGQTPISVAAAMQIVRNAYEQTIAAGDRAVGGTSRISDALQYLARVIDQNRDALSKSAASTLGLTARLVEAGAAAAKFGIENRDMIEFLVKETLAALALGKAFLFFRTLPAQITAVRIAMAGLTASTTASAAATGAWAAAGIKLGLLGATTALTTIKLFEAVDGYKAMRQAQAEAAEAAARLEKSQDTLAAKIALISKQTGVQLENFADLRKAVDEGRLHYDAATKSWVAGARQQVEAIEGVKKATGEALKEMQRQYQDYAKSIRDLQEQIIGRQRSLTAELRALARTGMTDTNAWDDQKREAEEYMQAARNAAQEAQAALKEGDTITAAQKWKDAVQYADDAKQAYKSLNTEVKDGDQTVIAKAEALRVALDGVKQAGELGIALLKEQQEAAHKAMDDLVAKSGFADLTEGMSAAEKIWLEKWRTMQTAATKAVEEVSFKISAQKVQIESIEQAWLRAWENNRNYFVRVTDELRRRLDEATKPRTVTIYTAEVVRRATGGMIPRFARGGKLPGYGGGDRVSTLLEAGEFVIRKEAVQRFGASFFHALNSLKLPDFSSLLPPLPALAAAPAGGKMTLELKLPGGDRVTATVQGDDAETLRRWNRRVSHLEAQR